MPSNNSHLIKLLDLTIIPREFKVMRAGCDINLPNLSFELLMFFVEHAQAVCTLEEISRAVWRNTVVSNDTIVQRVTLLRKALNDDAKSPKYIESVRGKGYRLLPLPRHIEDTHKKKKNVLPATMITALIFVGVLATWFLFLEPNPNNSLVLKEENNTVDSFIQRASYYYDIGQSQNLELAKSLYFQALEKSPGNIDALTGLSLVLSKLVCRYNDEISSAQQAKSLAEQAISIDKTNSKAHFALAYAWDCTGNLELALLNYTKSIELNPQHSASISSAAHLHFIKGDLLNAYALSKNAIELSPDSHMPKLQMATVLSLLNFTDEANAQLENLFNLYPDNVFMNQAYPKFLFEHGQLAEAKQAVELTFERNIYRASIYGDYAEIIWLLEGKNAALKWFSKAAKLSGNNSFADTIYQLVQEDLDSDEAMARLSTLNAIVEQGNTWPVNYIEASLISLWALNDSSMSIEYLQKAINLGYLNNEYLHRSPLFYELYDTEEDGANHSTPSFFELLENIETKREKLKQDFLLRFPNVVASS